MPRALASVGSLNGVVTDVCAQLAPWRFASPIPEPLRRTLIGKVWDRQLQDVDATRIQGALRFTLSRQIGRLRRRHGELLADYWARQNEAFGRAVVAADWSGANTVYAFNGCALETFREARRRGLRCILDQTAAPWRYNTMILQRERERWPGWEEHPADLDAGGRITAREEEEWALADRIVCGSSFVKDAIAKVGGPVQKTCIVPYPSPAPPPATRRTMPNRRTHVLFLGTLQLRKGIQYFSKIAEQLTGDRFAFRAIGPSSLSPHAEKIVRDRVDYPGAVSRTEVWDQYRWADVFLLPTLSEGSANACLEALSSGLPVITSLASGLASCNGLSSVHQASDSTTMVARLESLASSGLDKPDPVVPTRSIADYGRDLVNIMTTH